MNRRDTTLLALLLAAFGLIAAASVYHHSPTYDEPTSLDFGRRILSGKREAYYSGPMPIVALFALPGYGARGLPAGRVGNFLRGVFAARLVTIFFAAAIAAAVFAWSRELYGSGPAFGALLLFILSPEIIAHARFVTTDFFGAGLILLSLYASWRFMKSGGWGRGLLAAAATGAAQTAKYTALMLYPILLLIFAIRYAPQAIARIRGCRFRALAAGCGRFLSWAAVFVLTGLFFANLPFLFRGFGTPAGKCRFKSSALSELLLDHPSLGRIPLPVPPAYLQGIDRLQWKTETGDGFGYMYLFGQTKKVGGFRNYYLYAFLFKTPIALLILAALALVNYVSRPRRYRFGENESFLLIPIALFAWYVHARVTVNLGLRYLLPVFPLLGVFCASFFREWPRFRRSLKALIVVLFAYLAVSVLSYFPHFLSYCNEFVWNRTQAYRFLADSNLDWGQGEWYLARYLERHPEAVVNPPFPMAGRLVVGVNDLTGVWGPERYRWLRENFEPVGQIAHCYLVYDISAGE